MIVGTVLLENQAMKTGETKFARVLLADSDLASRLTLKSILSAAGYAVSGAGETLADGTGRGRNRLTPPGRARKIGAPC